MASQTWDTIVVGGGVMGLSTGYHLAKAGQRVLLLEQYKMLHKNGSSHGQSRLLRKLHPSNQMHYVTMVNDAEKEWRRLEIKSGNLLYRNTGVLTVSLEPSIIHDVEKSTKQLNLAYEKLNQEELKKRFPMLALPPEAQGIVEKHAGVLFAENALKTFLKLYKEHGGELHEEEAVTSIIPGDVITVNTPKDTYRTSKLVLTAGVWNKKLLVPLGLQLPLQPHQISVCFWKEKIPGQFSIENIPCIRFLGRTHAYSVPSFEHPGHFKMCSHRGIAVNGPGEPKPGSLELQYQPIVDLIANHFPTLDNTPAIVEKCYYTLTPDGEFILDKVPGHPNIVVGAGFCGHGFKLSPIVGKILGCLVLGEPTGYPMRNFSISRFTRMAKI